MLVENNIRLVSQSTSPATLPASVVDVFVAYCHVQLCRGDYAGAGDAALEFLLREHGINGHDTGEWPLGLYTNQQDVQNYLRGVGFGDEEIAASRVLRDTRLDGRLIVPWRDHSGNLRTVVAHCMDHDLSGQPRHLYRKCDATDDAFGLNIALRTTSGGKGHLVLVEGFLDVVYFQSRGFANTATFGPVGKTPTSQQWEQLADHGIRQVTLALADDEAGRERTLKSLRQAYQADRAPCVFALAPASLGSARSASLCARIQGMGELRHLVSRRLHGFHFVALSLIRQHRTGTEWTDAALIGLLGDAIDFDASVYTAERELELERFFWPSLLECLGARWSAVRRLLRRPLPQARSQAAVSDVRPAREQPEPPASPPVVSAPPVVLPMRHEVTIREPAPESAPSPAPQSPIAVPVDVQALAYSIWEAKGCPDDAHDVCWFEALRMVREEKIETIRHYAKTA